jgi:hypothetical protein
VEAARLRGACKALREVMDECPVDLGRVPGGWLKVALTCFPAAQSLDMVLDEEFPAADEWDAVELLRGHWNTLKRVTMEGDGAHLLLASAVRAGSRTSR